MVCGLIGGVDRQAPAAGWVEATRQELLEGALGKRTLVGVVAQSVMPVPDQPERHAEGEQDDPDEAAIDAQHEDPEDGDQELLD